MASMSLPSVSVILKKKAQLNFLLTVICQKQKSTFCTNFIADRKSNIFRYDKESPHTKSVQLNQERDFSISTDLVNIK